MQEHFPPSKNTEHFEEFMSGKHWLWTLSCESRLKVVIVSFKMYVKGSFISPISSFQSLTSIIYLHIIHSYYLLIYGYLLIM